jgi:hypothetical protein
MDDRKVRRALGMPSNKVESHFLPNTVHRLAQHASHCYNITSLHGATTRKTASHLRAHLHQNSDPMTMTRTAICSVMTPCTNTAIHKWRRHVPRKRQLPLTRLHVMLTTHPLLVPGLRKSRSYTSSHPNAPLWSVTGPLAVVVHVTAQKTITHILTDMKTSNLIRNTTQ